MKVSKLKGTQDFFGKNIVLFRYIEDVAIRIAKEFGYLEIQTPIIESVDCFKRGVGESSDIVKKEMYTFLDRGEKMITLRPEGTAGVSRSYVENKLYVEPGLKKYFYFEPMFRCERPQAGRFRQFHQFGVEAIGEGSPYLDADIIYFAHSFLKELGIDNVKILINTLGSSTGRQNYEAALKEYFSAHIDNMCDDCKERLKTNPLRILDCKVDKDTDIMRNAPKIIDYLTDEDRIYFEKVLSLLDNLNVPYIVDQKLVRGLDYYNNTVFEIVVDDASSSINGAAILGGGRYNGLSKEFDGPADPAIGFGSGVERLITVLDEKKFFEDYIHTMKCCVLSLGEENKVHALSLTNFLRKNHIPTDMDYVSYSLKSQFKLSERINALFLLIIGTDEVEQNVVKIKNTLTKEEKIISFEELNKEFGIEGNVYAYKK